MPSLRAATLPFLIVLIFYGSVFSAPVSGFFLPDSVNEMTLKYRKVKNLIVLSVIINDSVRVNLILDTGCRNLVLFGKRFQKLMQLNTSRQVQFSGLGSGSPVHGYLSLSNKVSIHQVLGEKIPVVVVPNQNILSIYRDVDGVIGYDIFFKFEIELNPRAQTITFRPATGAIAPVGFTQIPLRVVDSRPVMSSEIFIKKSPSKKCDLMIDTGSTLGLLLKTTNINEFDRPKSDIVIGYGFNGAISGYEIVSEKISVEGLEMYDLFTGVIQSQWHNHASIGMAILKDYVLILNYCKSYACLKRIEA